MLIINGLIEDSTILYVDTIETELAKVPKSDGTTSWNATALAAINAEIDGALNSIVPAAPTAGSVNDILSIASGSNTFNKATDSLEAIANKLISVQGGTDTLYSISQELLAILDVARDADSTTTTMDGSEQTLHEESAPTKLIQFLGGQIDLTNIAGARSLLVKVYVKLKSGGNYVQVSDDTAYAFTSANEVAIIPAFFNRYGYKITATQTEGEGFVTIDHEWYSASAGA
jgi:hypothetical protein